MEAEILSSELKDKWKLGRSWEKDTFQTKRVSNMSQGPVVDVGSSGHFVDKTKAGWR